MNSVCTICCDGCKEHGERVERDRIVALLKEKQQAYENLSRLRPARKDIDTTYTIARTYQAAINLIESQT